MALGFFQGKFKLYPADSFLVSPCVSGPATHTLCPGLGVGSSLKNSTSKLPKTVPRGKLEQLTLCIRGLTSTDSLELRTKEDADAEPTDMEG